MRDENNELPGNFLSELYKWALECECWFLLNNLHGFIQWGKQNEQTHEKKNYQTVKAMFCDEWKLEQNPQKTKTANQTEMV